MQPLILTARETLSPRITRFRFERPDKGPLPLFSGGAHVMVEMQDGDILRRNAYSLISDPEDGSGYEIAVQREDQGRGGSLFMHEKARPGDLMRVGLPVNLFALNLTARKHLLIAGGVGITPFIAQTRELQRLGLPYELHYAVRARDELAALPLLPEGVHVHVSAEGSRLDLGAMLSAQPLGTHLYVCASDDDLVRVFDPQTMQETHTLPSGPDPELFVLSPDGGRLYIANEDDNLVTVVDTKTHQMLAEIPVGVEPEGMGVSPDGKIVVNTSETTNMAHMIDTSSYEIVANVLVDSRPRFAEYTPDGKLLFVTAEIGGTVSVIDTATNEVTKKITTISTASPEVIEASGNSSRKRNSATDVSAATASASPVTPCTITRCSAVLP